MHKYCPKIRESPESLIEKQERDEYREYTKKVSRYADQIKEFEDITGDSFQDQQTHLCSLIDPPKEDEPLVLSIIALWYLR